MAARALLSLACRPLCERPGFCWAALLPAAGDCMGMAPTHPPPHGPAPAEDLRRWLIAQECDLFRARFKEMVPSDQVGVELPGVWHASPV